MSKKKEKRAHSKLGPSKSKRWIACPGSIALEDRCPPPADNEHSLRGTGAHALGELCYALGEDAGAFVGQEISIEGGEDFVPDAEDAEAVQTYLDFIRGLASDEEINLGRKLVKVEERFTLEWLHPGIFGSNDFMSYDVLAKHLHIVDYKHGVGVSVDPEWNPQLLMYGLGAMHSLWLSQSEKTRAKLTVLDMVEKVTLTIVQPRDRNNPEAVRTWEIAASDVLYWGLHVLKPAALATERDGARLCVGDHCKFCPALAVCPEQVKNAIAVAQTDFDTISLPDPGSLSALEIAKVLEASAIISAWASEVEKFAHAKALEGMEIPGRKLVRGRGGNRFWTNEDSATEALAPHLGEECFAPRKAISVAEAEKRLKKLGVSPEATLAGLWSKPEGSLVLVSESDKRPAAQPQAAMDFLDNADFLE